MKIRHRVRLKQSTIHFTSPTTSTSSTVPATPRVTTPDPSVSLVEPDSSTTSSTSLSLDLGDYALRRSNLTDAEKVKLLTEKDTFDSYTFPQSVWQYKKKISRQVAKRLSVSSL